MSKFDLLFPVTAKYYDYTVPLHSFDNVWVYLSTEDDEYTFLTKTNNKWSFCVAATEKDILMNIVAGSQKDNFSAVQISAKQLTEMFRTIELDGQMMFVKGGINYTCNTLQTYKEGPLYPSPNIMCIVLLKLDTTTNNSPDVYCVESTGKTCALIHDNPYDFLVITQIYGAWDNPKESLYMSYVPLQVIADKYDYVMYEKSVYNAKEYIALSSQSLKLMSDEYKEKINNGEVDVF